MKVFTTDKIKNIGIVAHGGAGKTSLTEAMLFNAGVTKRLGKVDDGNTVTDYYPEEIKRKITINTAVAPVVWRDHKLNILDTPGYSDFIGDVKSALRVADSIIMTVCAVSGVEVQTEIIWEMAEEQNIPRFVFINKMDRENANFYRVLDQLKEHFEGLIAPFQLPIGAETDFKGVVDLITQKALVFGADGKAKEEDIPADLADEVASYRESLIEAAAEGDDELLMKYLEGEELTPEEIYQGLQSGVKANKIIPVFCGSALQNIGVSALMDRLVDFAPGPHESEAANRKVDSDALSALTFKTLSDPYVGKLSFIRVFSGTMKSDSVVYNSTKEADEKIGQIFVMQGKTQLPIPEVHTGDIAALTKLQATATGDTLTEKSAAIVLEGIEFPVSNLSIAIEPKSKGDEDKLGAAIARLIEEDPTLRFAKNVETNQSVLTGMGEMHIDILIERLKTKFGVEVEQVDLRIPYRETIRAKATRVEGKHKKQSGGHGQYGHVFIDMEPITEAEFEFAETVFGGAVPRNYFPAVEKGIREAMMEGILAGYPVTNIKVTLTDGSYHAVDSSELAFKIAASLAFRKAMEQAKPVLLEPILSVEVTVPEQFMGDIMGDLNSKRGRILGMEPAGNKQVIRALVPHAEMHRYAIDLKSITQGRGNFTMEFYGYEEVPANIAEKVIEAAKEAKNN
ncbi:MAG: elongation factor G [Clostridia bacterium]|jgi:elongation factor G|nr:elongation factor G [Clostridia bacterium]